MAARRATRLPLGVVYGTGALIAAERDDRRVWALHARAIQRGVLPIVPAGCVVEAWRGVRQPSLSRLLDGCEIEPLAAVPAKRARALRRAVADATGPIDATVVESAVRRGAAIVTSDRGDIEQLAGAARRRVQIIDV